jgi:hypothetical protein
MCGNDKCNRNVVYRYVAYRYMAYQCMTVDRWNLSSSLPCGRAVSGSMKVSKDFRAGEVNGRYPRVFAVTIAFPVDSIFGVPAMEAVSNYFFHLVFGMSVGEFNRRWGNWSAFKFNIRVIRTEKFWMERIVNTAGEHWQGDI